LQLKPREIESFIKNPPVETEAVLLHGRDAGLVRERSKAIEAAILGSNPDPFRLVEMSEPVLKEEPGALYAEAAAISMLGGRKFIRVRIGPETAASALETYAAHRDAGEPKPDALVVFEAAELKATQRLRKLAESLPFAAAIPCYPDSEETLETLVDRMMKDAHVRLEPEAKALLLERLGGDRGVSRQEIEKLVLYAGDGASIGAADVLAVVGDSGAAEVNLLIDAVLSGNLEETDRLSRRLRASTTAIGVLRALSMQLDRLASAHSGGGGQQRGYGYYQSQATERYRSRWTTKLTSRARTIVLDAEISCKTTGLPVDAILERTLLMLARAVREAPGS
jgi:DNA polymerase III subunit delta